MAHQIKKSQIKKSYNDFVAEQAEQAAQQTQTRNAQLPAGIKKVVQTIDSLGNDYNNLQVRKSAMQSAPVIEAVPHTQQTIQIERNTPTVAPGTDYKTPLQTALAKMRGAVEEVRPIGAGNNTVEARPVGLDYWQENYKDLVNHPITSRAKIGMDLGNAMLTGVGQAAAILGAKDIRLANETPNEPFNAETMGRDELANKLVVDFLGGEDEVRKNGQELVDWGEDYSAKHINRYDNPLTDQEFSNASWIDKAIDPRSWNTAAESVPLSVAGSAPQYAVLPFLSRVPSWQGKAAGVIGSAALGAFSESQIESDAAYYEALRQGKTHDEAKAISDQVKSDNQTALFYSNLGESALFTPAGNLAGKAVSKLGTPALAATMSSPGAAIASIAGRIGADAVIEGEQERVQEMIQEKAEARKPMDWVEAYRKVTGQQESTIREQRAALAGMLMGVAQGSVMTGITEGLNAGSITQAPAEQNVDPALYVAQQMQTREDELQREAMQSALEHPEVQEAVIDNLAPEQRTIVASAVQNMVDQGADPAVAVATALQNYVDDQGGQEATAQAMSQAAEQIADEDLAMLDDMTDADMGINVDIADESSNVSPQSMAQPQAMRPGSDNGAMLTAIQAEIARRNGEINMQGARGIPQPNGPEFLQGQMGNFPAMPQASGITRVDNQSAPAQVAPAKAGTATIRDTGDAVTITHQDGARTGAVDAQKVADNTYLVTRVNVPEDARGKGQGRVLLNKLVQWHKDTGNNLALQIQASGDMDNSSLESWYRSKGFVNDEAHPELFTLGDRAKVLQDLGIQATKGAESVKTVAPGGTATAKTERGTSVNVQYVVVNAENLIASHDKNLVRNPNYPEKLQPRNRERVASKLQINQIANQLEPEFLGESPKASEGAPIVGPDMVVESGNGRVIALQTAYGKSGKTDGYKSWLISNAAKFGLTPEQIQQIANPVLVRVRQSDVDRVQFVKEANEQSVAAMSATEQSKADAASLSSELLEAFSPGENGEILVSSNSNFITAFLSDVVGPTEQGRYIASDGQISQEGITRIRNAIFARAYEDADLIARLAESTDNNIKNITNALLIMAPKFTQLKAAIEAGTFYDLDITGDIVDSVKHITSLRGQPGMDLDKYIADFENEYFGEAIAPTTKMLLTLFNKYKRSAKMITKALNAYIDGAVAIGEPKQISLTFAGDADAQIPTKLDVLRAAIQKTTEEGNANGYQGNLFENTGNQSANGKPNGRNNEERRPAGNQQEAPGSSEKEPELQQPETAEQGRALQRLPEGVKIGPSGRAAIKRWAQNERFIINLEDVEDQDTIDFLNFAHKYWLQGFEGRPQESIGRKFDSEFELTKMGTWLEDAFYKAGERDASYAAKRQNKKQQDAKPESTRKTEDVANKDFKTAATEISDWVANRLKAGEAFTNRQYFDVCDKAFGGTQGQGVYTVKDAYDIMETGVNKYIASAEELVGAALRGENVIKARHGLGAMVKITELLPTQSNRTSEQIELQQFSTPPALAYLVNWIAGISNNETVIEPSAGNGGLAAFAKAIGAKVIVNEISERRRELSSLVGFDGYYGEDAAYLNDALPQGVKPTTVIMNPPFSANLYKPNERKTMNATKHIEQALDRLEPGGRLVAIVGRGMGESATFKPWWKKIRQDYEVRVNVLMDGSNYKKYGTSFDNRLIVIDKTGQPQEGETFTGEYKDLMELFNDLNRSGIRRDRYDHDLRRMDSDKTEENRNPGNTESSVQPGGKSTPVQDPQTGSGMGTNAGGTTDVGGTGQVAGASDRSTGRGGRSKPGGRNSGSNRNGTRSSSGTSRGGVSRDGNQSKQNDEGSGGQPSIHDRNDAPPQDVRVNTGQSQEYVDKLRNDEVAEIEVNIRDRSKQVNNNEKLSMSTFEDYEPYYIDVPGAKPHPTQLAESAAMATVRPQVPDYRPMLPTGPIKRGELSDAQLETVIYAGMAHSEILPSGERKGFFIGDGTGVGKAREIGAIILDNMYHGRKKSLWISNGWNLYEDAKSNYKNIGGDPDSIKSLQKYSVKKDIEYSEGTLFLTYPLLIGEGRLDQIVNWLGKDFDGVIAFDEAHNMKKAVLQRVGRYRDQASKTALAGIALQEALPKARIVYASATGATDVYNFAYAARLGLWGKGTPFPNVNEFINEITSGGIAAMEVLARDLKALGVYLARSLSYKGVTYGVLEHKLTPDQTLIYDKICEGWQVTFRGMQEALETTNGQGTKADSDINKNFWSTEQKFFNQVLTSMQMPSVVESIKKDLANGNAVVVQMINTNEAAQKRAAAKFNEGDDLADLDLSPKDLILNLVDTHFPIETWVDGVDSDGNPIKIKLLDSNGKPVINKKALKEKERLMAELALIKMPDGALNILIDEFGTDAVAEITGRKQRLVWTVDPKTGQEVRVWQNHGDAGATADKKAFDEGRKLILVFTQKGDTGASYHSSLDIENQRKRIHYLIQPGWQAIRAIQALGRTHRSNQAHTPHIVLVTTNMRGHKRFISTIARRIAQLGALTKGQRDASGQELFSSKDNLESRLATQALFRFWEDLIAGRIEGYDTKSKIEGLLYRMGLHKGSSAIIDDSGNLNMSSESIWNTARFLNRILALKSDEQNNVFDAFAAKLEQLTEEAEASGSLNDGMENYVAERVDVVEEKVIHVDEKSNAETTYMRLRAQKAAVKVDYERFSDLAGFMGLYRNTRSDKLWALRKHGDTTLNSGRVVPRIVQYGQYDGERAYTNIEAFEKGAWEAIPKQDAKRVWREALEALPDYKEEEVHLISGTLLRIWDRLPHIDMRIMRVKLSDGRKVLGLILPDAMVDQVLERFSVDADLDLSPLGVYDLVMNKGRQVNLANGWSLQRKMVSGEKRLEIVGNMSWAQMQEITKINNVFKEKVGNNFRFFISTGREGLHALEEVLRYHPAVGIEKRAKAKTMKEANRNANISNQQRNRQPINTEAWSVRDSQRARLTRVEREKANRVLVREHGGIKEGYRRSSFEIEPGAIDSSPELQFASRLAWAAGKKLVPYRYTSADPQDHYFDGMMNDGYMFVSLNNVLNHVTIALHEAFHALAETVPNLAEAMYRDIMAVKPDFEAIVSIYIDESQRGWYSRDIAMEEFAGDLVAWRGSELMGIDTSPVFAREELEAVFGSVEAARGVADKLVDSFNGYVKQGGLTMFERPEGATIETGGKTAAKTQRGPPARSRATAKTREREIVPVFYSQLERTIQEKMPKRAHATHVLALIGKGAVKEEELQWSGIREWLKDRGMVTQDEVLAFVRANEIQIKSKENHSDGQWAVDLRDNETHFFDTLEEAQKALDMENNWIDRDSFTVWHDESGGTIQVLDQNYERLYEVLRDSLDGETLWIEYVDYEATGQLFETFGGALAAAEDFAEKQRDEWRSMVSSEPYSIPTAYSKYTVEGGDNYQERLFMLPDIEGKYKSVHFDDINIVAHARTKDREATFGDVHHDVLFVEEVQSDWHQEGRKNGYAKDGAVDAIINEFVDKYPNLPEDVRAWHYVPMIDAGVTPADAERWENAFRTVPDAPFKTTWHELVMKRLLRLAAEEGYDAIAWTTGEQQNERYSLHTHVDKLIWTFKPGMDEGNLYVQKDGRKVLEKDMPAKDLPEMVGKEIADRLLSAPTKDVPLDAHSGERGKQAVLSGLDLKIGGEGMKGFYDRMLPSFMKKYVKKWGATVETRTVDRFTGPAHYIEITPAMRDAVLYSGQPKYKTVRNRELYQFPNERVAEEINAAHGARPAGLTEKLKDGWTDTWKKLSREFEHLPHSGEYAELRKELLLLKDYKGIANEKTKQYLEAISRGLDAYEYSVFENKILIDDLIQEHEAERAIPFWGQDDDIYADQADIDRVIAELPKVQRALEMRKAMMESVKSDYIQAMKSIGYNVSDRLTKEDYFHHQVLEYMNLKSNITRGAGKEIKTPRGRGFTKQREGSELPINTDYLQSEFEVISQMIYDQQIARVIQAVKREHNIVDELKRQAAVMNETNVLEIYMRHYRNPIQAQKEFNKDLHQKQAIAHSRIYAMAARGHLPVGDNEQWEDVVEALAKVHQGLWEELNPPMRKRYNAYLAWLANGPENEAKILARTVFKGMREKQQYMKEVLERGYLTWQDLVPEDHVTWQPIKGNMFFMADSISASLAEQIYAGALKDAGIDESQLRKILAVGQKYPEMVVPEPVALTLDSIQKVQEEGDLKKLYHRAFQAWKQWTLIMPKRAIKYNVRNMTGDLDALLAGNPSALKKVPQALKDIAGYYIKKDGEMTRELHDWFERGGFQNLFQAQEISDINRQRQFKHLMAMREREKRNGLPDTVADEIKESALVDYWFKYFDSVRAGTDFREAIFRYACYLDYLEQINTNKGKPNNFGASLRDEVMSLHSYEDRAFRLSNDLMGAYNEVGVVGQWLADNLMPFYRWKEVNFRRYMRLMRNAHVDARTAATIGGQMTRGIEGAAKMGAYSTIKMGRLFLQATMFSAAVYAFNMAASMAFGGDEPDKDKNVLDRIQDIDQDMPADARTRQYLYFGKDDAGNVRYFTRVGALQDFLNWFGLDTPITDILDIVSGKRTYGEVAKDEFKSMASDLMSLLGPQYTVPVGLIWGNKTYPDAFRPSHIYDKTEFIFNTFGLSAEYKAATGKPTKKSYGSSWKPSQLVWYESDPDESAYFEVRDWVRNYRMGEASSGSWNESAKSQALYNCKAALRYGDIPMANRYLAEYVAQGGNKRGVKQSLARLDPMYGLSEEKRRNDFMNTLSVKEREKVARAIDYYNRNILAKKPGLDATLFDTVKPIAGE